MNSRILQEVVKPCFFDKFLPTSMQNQTCLVKTIFIIGLFIFVKFLFKTAYLIWDLWLAPTKLANLTNRYGPGSYVVITGTTAGIGKALARHFVSLGFNIVQISRNKAKLDTVEKELIAINPKVKVITQVLDLQACH